MRSKIPLILALVLAVMAVYMIAQYLQSQKVERQFVNVVVAQRDIRRGDQIRGELFATRQIDAQAYNPNMILSGEENQFINYYAAIDYRKDDFLLRPGLIFEIRKKEPLAPRVPEGMRAVSLPVNRIGSVTGMVEAGDRVDILIYLEVPKITEQTANINNVGMVPMQEERKEKVLIYLLQDITVLAVGQQIAQEVVSTVFQQNEEGYDTITITCTPEEAPVLAFASLAQSGGVPFWLLLRNPSDQGRLNRVQITRYDTLLEMTALDALLKKRAELPRVQIIERGSDTGR